jgi:hypothetical protein
MSGSGDAPRRPPKKRASRNLPRDLDITPSLEEGSGSGSKRRAAWKKSFRKFAEDVGRILDRDSPEGASVIPWVFSASQVHLDTQINRIEQFNIEYSTWLRSQGVDVPISGLPIKTICVKARKVMWSTYFRGRGVWRNEFWEGNKGLCMAHNDVTTKDVLNGFDQLFLSQWDPTMDRSDIVRMGQETIEWKHHSMTMFRTAGSRGQGVMKGSTLHYLHFSEFSSYPPKNMEVANANEAAAKYHESHIESTVDTANIQVFKDIWDKAMWLDEAIELFRAGEAMPASWNGRFRIFWAWWQDSGYRTPLTPAQRKQIKSTLSEKEVWLIEQFRLTEEQLQWRRLKIEGECSQQTDMSPEDYFMQHYPSTPEEAFMAKGRNVFPREKIKRLQDYSQMIVEAFESGKQLGKIPYWVGNVRKNKNEASGFSMHESKSLRGANCIMWEPPKPKNLYVFGGDPAQGKKESDDNVTIGMNRCNGLVLREAVSYCAKVDGEYHADLTVFLCRLFNDGYLVGERNTGDAFAFMRRVVKNGYSNIYHYSDPEVFGEQGQKDSFTAGFNTTPRTKAYLSDITYTMFEEDALMIFHPKGLKQCYDFRRDEKGNPCAPDGDNDDFPMAYMFCVFGNQPGHAPPVWTPGQLKAAQAEAEAEKWAKMTGPEKDRAYINEKVEMLINKRRKENERELKELKKARAVLDGGLFD